MGFASPYEVLVQPLARDGPLLCFLIFVWMFVHYMVHVLSPKVIPRFHRFDKKKQEDVVLRIVSAINGVVMCTGFPIFVKNAMSVGISPYNDIYREIPEYRFYRVCITSYFFWDTAVCFYYRWGLMWQIHGLCSLIGTFFLMFPMCDDLASYYGGCFEGTNPLLHVSVILRMIADACKVESSPKSRDTSLKRRCNSVATVLEYTFGLGYFVIRVVGGTIVTFCCIGGFARALLFDWTKRQPDEPSRSHNEVVLVLCILACAGVQLLQYVWFVAIVKKALGWDEGDASASAGKDKTVVQEGRKKK